MATNLLKIIIIKTFREKLKIMANRHGYSKVSSSHATRLKGGHKSQRIRDRIHPVFLSTNKMLGSTLGGQFGS